MDISYVVMTHKDPHQVRRLISRLQHPQSYFYVHVDAAVPIEPFKEALQDLRNVHFIDNRVDVPWGSWKMIEVQLLGVESALRDERNGFCMLVSGQDYPIKHPDMLRATLEANPDKLFINSVPMEELWDDYYRRVNHYNYGYREPYRFFLHFPSIFRRDFYRLRTLEHIGKLLLFKRELRVLGQIFIPRRFPSNFKAYGGSAWWALPVEFLKKIMRVHRENPSFNAYHKYSLIPDEIYFQALVTYLNGEKRLLNRLTYDNWEREGVQLPVSFSENSDLDLLLAQPEFIARKFEPDSPILDALDEAIGFEPWNGN
jgi:hypothetical protein